MTFSVGDRVRVNDLFPEFEGEEGVVTAVGESIATTRQEFRETGNLYVFEPSLVTVLIKTRELHATSEKFELLT